MPQLIDREDVQRLVGLVERHRGEHLVKEPT